MHLYLLLSRNPTPLMPILVNQRQVPNARDLPRRRAPRLVTLKRRGNDRVLRPSNSPTSNDFSPLIAARPQHVGGRFQNYLGCRSDRHKFGFRIGEGFHEYLHSNQGPSADRRIYTIDALKRNFWMERKDTVIGLIHHRILPLS